MKSQNGYTWLLDAGHGGLTSDGRYTTAPAKMHVFDDVCDEVGAKVHGFTFYEGVNNRAIVDKLTQLLDGNKIDYARVYDQELDTPLSNRVETANKLHAKKKQCIYLSIHSDAMPEGLHGRGSGVSIYTSKGNTGSDRIATIFCDTYAEHFSQFKLRRDLSDGDADFEENFYVLRKTTCPAILIENLFFDNRREAEFLLSDKGQQKIAEVLLLSIMSVEQKRPV